MARKPRLAVAGQIHWVTWLGHNRQAVCMDEQDRSVFLALLAEAARREGVQVHAYALLTNEVHLLVTPAQADALARCMQAVGRAYVRRFNDRHLRSGTLWAGRYRSLLVQPDWAIWAMVWFDGLAGAAGAAPEQGAGSSFGHYAGRRHDKWLSAPPAYWTLGNTPFAREAAYAQWAGQGLSASQRRAWLAALNSGWALGSPAYQATMGEALGQPLLKRRAGRPAKI
mgnify:CR=1 FL=1